MSRLVSRPVAVKTARGVPFSLRLGGEERRIRLVEEWHEGGEWWREEGEIQVYRALDERGGIFEILFDTRTRSWSLDKIYD